uniref:Uncharacterized protein n=1 Tax=Timema shepardi TaxID=629360 RepID=A0A7R9AKP5_TIMSH|nr:unnamed protein product [Timema shepardi]
MDVEAKEICKDKEVWSSEDELSGQLKGAASTLAMVYRSPGDAGGAELPGLPREDRLNHSLRAPHNFDGSRFRGTEEEREADSFGRSGQEGDDFEEPPFRNRLGPRSRSRGEDGRFSNGPRPYGNRRPSNDKDFDRPKYNRSSRNREERMNDYYDENPRQMYRRENLGQDDEDEGKSRSRFKDREDNFSRSRDRGEGSMRFRESEEGFIRSKEREDNYPRSRSRQRFSQSRERGDGFSRPRERRSRDGPDSPRHPDKPGYHGSSRFSNEAGSSGEGRFMEGARFRGTQRPYMKGVKDWEYLLDRELDAVVSTPVIPIGLPIIPPPPPILNTFQNDGSFLEMFKKMHEPKEEPACAETETSQSNVPEAVVKKPVTSIVGKRRGGRVLPTGMVKKVRKGGEEADKPTNAWSLYMAEVRKYKELSCEEEGKTRPLVK